MRIPKPDFQRDLSYLEETNEVKITEDNSSFLTSVLIVLDSFSCSDKSFF